MTPPKEKALELISIYVGVHLSSPFLHHLVDGIRIGLAKQCALIAIDEIIKTYTNKDNSYWLLEEEVNYWQEVKQEIIKL
jgi:hypothetical protein